jgi:hypothetical protein
MKTIRDFCSRHLAALSLALVGTFGLLGVGVAAAPVASAATKCTTVSCVQQFGDAAINARLAALEKLKADAQNHKALTDDQRHIIINDVNTNENSLKSLKQKLDGETDIKAALIDVHNIYVQFRIYAVVLPRDYGEILLFHEQNAITRMSDAQQTITDLIQKDQNGKNIDQIKALDQDYMNKLHDATKNTTAAQALIPSLVPANFPGTSSTLKTYRGDLKAARLDIQGAANDLHQMIQLLKEDLGSSASSS